MLTPTTKSSWQEAANLARVLLVLQRAAEFGLVRLHFSINADECERVLAVAQQHRIAPTLQAIEPLVGGLKLVT